MTYLDQYVSVITCFSDDNGAYFAIIQGSRVTATDPWLADSGAPLPFVAPIIGGSNVAGETRILALNSGEWNPFDPGVDTYIDAVCEIP